MGGRHNAESSLTCGKIHFPYFPLEPSAIAGVALSANSGLVWCRILRSRTKQRTFGTMKSIILHASVLLALMVSASAFAQVNQSPAKPASASPANGVPAVTARKPKSPSVAINTQSNSPNPSASGRATRPARPTKLRIVATP